MFKRHPESLSIVMLRSLRDLGVETPLQQKHLIDSWPEVVGKTVARYTTDIRISNQSLIVHINNPSLRSDLMMMRSRLVALLNEKAGSHLITEIIFR
jgi:predicted nucleic acid-binding Zn ribbon protein